MGTNQVLRSVNTELKIMEVCGTHSEVVSKYALRQFYTGRVKLVSGPGCPVCVIASEDIDLIIEYARCGFTIVTFGDLIRIPGTVSSLAVELAHGKSIKVVYSPLDALAMAKDNPSNQVIFVAVGFETTAPLVALTIMKAKKEGIKRVRVHILLDGRDVGETSALEYVDPFEAFLSEIRSEDFDAKIASGGGRMKITMDRYEANWGMVELGWKTHVLGEGRYFASAREAIETLRAETHAIDQDLPPLVIAENGEPVGTINDNDSVVFYNFRGDRAIEISRAFEEQDFDKFDRKR